MILSGFPELAPLLMVKYAPGPERYLFDWRISNWAVWTSIHLHSHQPSGVMPHLHCVNQRPTISFYLQHQFTGLIQSLSAVVKVFRKPGPAHKSLWGLKTHLRLSGNLLFAIELRKFQLFLMKQVSVCIRMTKRKCNQLKAEQKKWITSYNL